ncbi:MAG: hypothetical protein FJW99_05680 [Actinobacteria bacterium]|nr:hypothetical protein [Actinomycetota bacterium]MBM3697140.1 hypothetical protein [Actinomycetota bacterium]
MNTASGVFFTWLLGLIFVVGGIVFLVFLGENKLLFGLPYLVIGLLLCYGAWRLGKSAARKAAEEAAAMGDEGQSTRSEE